MPIDPNKIQAILDSRKMTRADLSRETDIAPPHITRIMSGQRNDPQLSTVEKLAKALRCSLSRIMQ